MDVARFPRPEATTATIATPPTIAPATISTPATYAMPPTIAPTAIATPATYAIPPTIAPATIATPATYAIPPTIAPATIATATTIATPPTTATATIVNLAPLEAPVIIPRSTENEVLLRFDPDYLITVPGIIKIVQIILCLISFICIQVTKERSNPLGRYYSWTTGIGFFFSGTVLGLYLFHVVEKYQHKIPWLKIELAFSGTWTIGILVGSVLCAGMWPIHSFVAAGHIGFRTSVAYGIDFYLKWVGVLRGHLAQEKRVEYQCPPAAAHAPVISTVRLPPVQQC